MPKSVELSHIRTDLTGSAPELSDDAAYDIQCTTTSSPGRPSVSPSVVPANSSSSSASTPSLPQSWWSWVKANTPSVISLLSVVLNIVILSVLIPQMKQDIATMQGQAASVQNSMGYINTNMVSVTRDIAQVSSKIDGFNSQFNATQEYLLSFSAQIQLSASLALDTFTQQSAQFQRNINATTTESQRTLDNIRANAATADQQVRELLNQTSMAVDQLRALNETVIEQLVQAQQVMLTQMVPGILNDIAIANSSSVSSVQSVSNDFQHRVIPNFLNDMANLNYSTLLAKSEQRTLQSLNQMNGTVVSSANTISTQVATVTSLLQYTQSSSTDRLAPVWRLSNGTASMTVSSYGNYQRFGRQVTFTFYAIIDVTSLSDPSSSLVLEIPFNRTADVPYQGFVPHFLASVAKQGVEQQSTNNYLLFVTNTCGTTTRPEEDGNACARVYGGGPTGYMSLSPSTKYTIYGSISYWLKDFS